MGHVHKLRSEIIEIHVPKMRVALSLVVIHKVKKINDVIKRKVIKVIESCIFEVGAFESEDDIVDKSEYAFTSIIERFGLLTNAMEFYEMIKTKLEDEEYIVAKIAKEVTI